MLTESHYQPQPGRFDEAVADDGALRPAWSAVEASLRQLRPIDLLDRQRRADRLLDAEGAGHLVHDLVAGCDGADVADGPIAASSRPWRLDPIPMVIHTPCAAQASHP